MERQRERGEEADRIGFRRGLNEIWRTTRFLGGVLVCFACISPYTADELLEALFSFSSVFFSFLQGGRGSGSMEIWRYSNREREVLREEWKWESMKEALIDIGVRAWQSRVSLRGDEESALGRVRTAVPLCVDAHEEGKM